MNHLPTTNKPDVYSLVTDRIIEKLEAGTIPWIHYLKSGPRGYQLPKNLVTKKPYKGINVFLLGMSEFSSPWWLTFNQCADLGGRIRKGEHGTIIVFWKRLDLPESEHNEHSPEEHEHDRPYFVLRYYRVFNVQQCEGLRLPELETPAEAPIDDITPIERAEEIARSYLAQPNAPRFTEVDYARTASYSPIFDHITMAAPKFHISAEEYAAAKFHEMAHSTSHPTRLNRKLEGCAGNRSEYSREELVAEMGASMLCALSGIFERTIENSAAYIQGWLSVLKADKKAVFVAAGKAQRAADFILNRIEQNSEPQAQLAMAA
jgi:antirestriction protein ArdC